jgi:F0F1-type ATP synthase membrane subunit b/b'
MVPASSQPNLPAVAAPPIQGSIALPVEQPRDFISKLKANSKNRKAMMEALDAHYASQLDGLRAQLSAGLRVHKTKLDLQAEEYLKSLDAQHLEVLGQLGIRNAATRWKAIMELNDMAVAKIREVQEKQWPESLIDETVSQILAVKNRVAGEVMREFGAEKPATE